MAGAAKVRGAWDGSVAHLIGLRGMGDHGPSSFAHALADEVLASDAAIDGVVPSDKALAHEPQPRLAVAA